MDCNRCSLVKYYNININEINSSDDAQHYYYRVMSSNPYLPLDGIVNITWSITNDLKNEGIGSVSGDDVHRLIRECLREYEKVIAMRFIEKPDRGPDLGDHINQRFTTTDYKNNPIMRIGKHPDGAGGSLAHTSIAYEGYGGDNFSDIHLDSDEPFTFNKLKTIMLHEMGHAFGMGHSTRNGTLMYPSYSTNFTAPDESIIRGLKTLYPSTEWGEDSVNPFSFHNYRGITIPFDVSVKIANEGGDNLICKWDAFGTLPAGNISFTKVDNTYTATVSDFNQFVAIRSYCEYTATVDVETIKYLSVKVGDSLKLVKVLVKPAEKPIILTPSEPKSLIRSEQSSIQVFNTEIEGSGAMHVRILNPSVGDELFTDDEAGVNLILQGPFSQIQKIRFRNTLVQPSEYTRNIELYVNNGVGDSNKIVQDINFTTGNKLAILQVGDVVYTEQSTISLAPDATLVDETVSYAGFSLEVYLVDSTETQGIWIDGIPRKYLRFDFDNNSSKEDCLNIIKQIKYTDTSDSPRDAIIKWEIKDPELPATVVTQIVKAVNVNDSAKLNLGGYSVYRNANKVSRLIYYTQKLSFTDKDEQSYIGGYIRVTSEGRRDSFSFIPSVYKQEQSNIVYNGLTVGTLDEFGQKLLINLNENTKKEHVLGMINCIGYRSVATRGETSNRLVTVTVKDANETVEDTIDIYINSIVDESTANVAPVLMMADRLELKQIMNVFSGAKIVDANSSDMNGGSLKVDLEGTGELKVESTDTVSIQTSTIKNVWFDTQTTITMMSIDNRLVATVSTLNTSKNITISFGKCSIEDVEELCKCVILTSRDTKPKTIKIRLTDGDGTAYGGSDTGEVAVSIS